MTSMELPAGTVTFLFTDIEGSTRLWEEQPEDMKTALARHDALLLQAVDKNGGSVVKTTGDGMLAVFPTAYRAVQAATNGQHLLNGENWDVTIGQIRARMGIHTGTADERDGDYFGRAPNRAARLMACGHGGQILLSQTTEALVRDDLHSVGHICQLLEGLPLGILLAAAWSDMLSPDEIAREIARGLDFLETEMRDMPGRHRSIRATFGYSYDRLGDADREVFKTLSVFRGGFTGRAAGEIAGATLQMLASLVSKSLLQRDLDSGRYQLHELLRQFAQERLAQDPPRLATANKAHAEYFAGYVSGLWSDLTTSRQREALNRLVADIENVRAAWLYWAGSGRPGKLSGFLMPFWLVHEVRGWYQPAVKYIDRALLALDKADGDDEAELIRYQLIGMSAYFVTVSGAPEEGLDLAEKALDKLRPLDQQEALLIPLHSLAFSVNVLGRPDLLMATAVEMRDIGLALNLEWWAIHALSWLGHARLIKGDYARARQAGEELQAGIMRLGSSFGFAWSTHLLAELHVVEDSFDRATAEYLEALKPLQAIDYKRGVQAVYNGLGDIALAKGELEMARSYYLDSLGISETTGLMREMAGTVVDIFHVLIAMGRPDEAAVLAASAVENPASQQYTQFAQGQHTRIREEAQELLIGLEKSLAPDALASARESGRTLSLSQAAALALGD